MNQSKNILKEEFILIGLITVCRQTSNLTWVSDIIFREK
jgi:hypothetical protein